MYTHKPLDRDKSEIRLVRFAPAADGRENSAQFSLELRHDSLDNEAIDYVALSYVWGDPSNPSQALINGTPFEIGRNLHAALEALSKTESVKSSWLWIDAICINQSDPLEKTWQVAQMGDIYPRASLVCAWLGPGSAYTDRALAFIERLGSRAAAAGFTELTEMTADMLAYLAARPAGEPLDEGKTYEGDSELSRFVYDFLNERGMYGGDLSIGIQQLMLNEYWSRIWIVQEILRAKRGLLLCGDGSASLDAFLAIWLAAGMCIFFYCPGSRDYSGFMPLEGSRPTWWFKLPLLTRHRLDIRSFVRLDELLFQGSAICHENYYLATDPRDILFALLGVVSESERLGLEVDYTKTTTEVYTSLTRALINKADELPRFFHLGSAAPRMHPVQGLEDLPSWVPNWSAIGKYGMVEYNINKWESFDATKGTKAVRDDAEALGVLRRTGCHVDTVTEVMQKPSTSGAGDDTQVIRAAVFAFTDAEPEASPDEDHVWRTVIAPSALYSQMLSMLDDRTEARHLIRSIMRQEPLEADKLSREAIKFIQVSGRLIPDFSGPPENIMTRSDLVNEWADSWARGQFRSVFQVRRLFKTAKGMLGLAHEAIRPGDQVTLQWGVKSPIVLRRLPETSGGGERFQFLGDAYVDGIMFGEFLGTDPEERVFDVV